MALVFQKGGLIVFGDALGTGQQCCCKDEEFTCSGNVTFVVTNFLSTAKSNGANTFFNDDPNGTYVGSLEADCAVVATGQPLTVGFPGDTRDCWVFPIAGYTVFFLAYFVRPSGPSAGSCASTCRIQFSAVNRNGLPNKGCPGFQATTRAGLNITVAELTAGVSLTEADFTTFLPSTYLLFHNLKFNLFVQRNPLP